MSPTIFRSGRFRFFFFSREESRPHVHVASPAGEAKFWLDPLAALAQNHGLSDPDIREIVGLIALHEKEIRDAWHSHFGG